MRFAPLSDKISAVLDRYEDDHDLTGCPARPGECLHSAVAALRAVVRRTKSMQEPGAPFFWPGFALLVERDVAEALGIDHGIPYTPEEKQ